MHSWADMTEKTARLASSCTLGVVVKLASTPRSRQECAGLASLAPFPRLLFGPNHDSPTRRDGHQTLPFPSDIQSRGPL